MLNDKCHDSLHHLFEYNNFLVVSVNENTLVCSFFFFYLQHYNADLINVMIPYTIYLHTLKSLVLVRLQCKLYIAKNREAYF
jgi:hypothetical protein